MQNNNESQGTFSNNNGLSLDDAEKFFNEIQGKTLEEIKNIPLTSAPEATPEPTPAPAAAEPAKVETQEAVPTPGSTPAPQEPDASTSVTTTQPSDPYAWVNQIENEEIKNRIVGEIRARQDAEHRYKSANGRVTALQHKVLEVNRQLSSGNPNQQHLPPQNPSAAPSTAPKTYKEWEALIETDKELALAVDARLDSRMAEMEERFNQRVGALRESVIDPLYEHQSEQYLESERSKLLEAVPNYIEVVNSPLYQHWITNMVSPDLHKSVTRTRDHADAIRYLQMYASDVTRAGLVTQTQTPPAATQVKVPAPATLPVATELADKVQKDRDTRLTTPAVTKAGPTLVPAAKQSNEISVEDAQAYFDHVLAERKKGNAILR